MSKQNTTPTLTSLKLLQKSKQVELVFNDGETFSLTCEYLRVFSPSAEVRGHHPSQMKLVTGKENVNIVGIDPIGHYAVKLIFDDGHDTGIYSFDTLYQLAKEYEQNWQIYQLRLQAAGSECQHE